MSPREMAGGGQHQLGHARVEVRPHYDAFLLMCISSRTDEDRWRPGAIDGNVWHSGRDVQVVASVGHITVLELIAGPELDLVPADHVEARFVVLMGMGFGPRSRRYWN